MLTSLQPVPGFQSTLLVRGATATVHDYMINRAISIHAPRERSDSIVYGENMTEIISIHAPRERSDKEERQPLRNQNLFQSTLLVRGATHLSIPRLS